MPRLNDSAHISTDDLISEMEQKITREYSQAVKEMTAKLRDYMHSFEAKDEEKRKQVDAGKITQEEYDQWRTGQLATGRRWENMRNSLATDLHNSNRIAHSIVNGYMPEVYALNRNYGTYQIESELGIDTSFTLYDRPTVEALLREEPDLLQPPGKQMKKTFGEFDAYKSGKNVKISPQKKAAFDKYIAENRDIRWQKGKLQSVMLQGILQGESIPNIAKRIARDMGEINRKASIRYARTAATSAENRGRIDSYRRAESMGIEMQKEWMATPDGRTRDSHVELDGVKVDTNAAFPNKCMYPGDPAGAPEEVWNCRCTLVAAIKGYDHERYTAKDFRAGISFDEWQAQKKAKAAEEAKNKQRERARKQKPSFQERIKEIIDNAKKSNRGITTDDIHAAGKIFAEDIRKEYIDKIKMLEQAARDAAQKVKNMAQNVSQEEYQALKSEFMKARDEYVDLLNSRYDYMKGKIGLIRDVGIGNADIKGHFSGRSQMNKAVQDAYDHYPSSWVQQSIDAGKLQAKKVSRGYYDHYGSVIAISGEDKENQREVATHELGHRFEQVVPGILDQEREFYNRRTAGEDLEWLGAGYARHEKTRRDNFIHSYMGKDYGGDAYELVSMGFQYAYDEPATLAKDPDMQEWILGMLLLL